MISQQMMPIIIPRLSDPGSASVDERDEHLMLLESARHALDVEWTETLAVFDQAGDHHVFGYPSTVAYLKHRLRMAGGRAHRYVRNARSALRHTATFSAWKHRLVSSDEANLMFQASARAPDEYARAERDLLEMVGEGVDETMKVLGYWRNDVDSAGVKLQLEEQLLRRRFDITRRNNGLVTGDFELPQMAGETLLTAIDALMPPPTEYDERTTGQRRADALEDLARTFLDGSASPIVGGEKPHLNIHVDLDAIEGRAGGLHETEDGVVLAVENVRQLVCDASVSRIVFGSGSEVLDVGRKTRIIPAGLRRAVMARDRHCVAPGCRRSARWCDVHHVLSWADGGETVIDNLCLLCRYHHTQVHLELIDVPAIMERRVRVDGRST